MPRNKLATVNAILVSMARRCTSGSTSTPRLGEMGRLAHHSGYTITSLTAPTAYFRSAMMLVLLEIDARSGRRAAASSAVVLASRSAGDQPVIGYKRNDWLIGVVTKRLRAICRCSVGARSTGHSPLPIETVNHESHHALGRLTSSPKSRVWSSWRCGRIGLVFQCCSLWPP
jgi:hypothetical protein